MTLKFFDEDIEQPDIKKLFAGWHLEFYVENQKIIMTREDLQNALNMIDEKELNE